MLSKLLILTLLILPYAESTYAAQVSKKDAKSSNVENLVEFSPGVVERVNYAMRTFTRFQESFPTDEFLEETT